MTVSTVSSLNSLFNDIYGDTIFVAREKNLMAGLVTNYAARGWMDREVAVYPELTAQEVADGTDYSSATEWTTTSQLTLTPKEVITQVVVTDRHIETSPNETRRDAAREMGGAIATKIDGDLLDLFDSFTTDKGAAGSALTIKRVVAGLSVLHNNKAQNPINIVVHPYCWHDIWVELGQPSAEPFLGELANQAMRDYFVGQFLGARWFISANIDVDGSDDAVNGAFHHDALALDTRKPITLEVERDASLRAWELNVSAGYACGIRDDDLGVKFTADATEPTGV